MLVSVMEHQIKVDRYKGKGTAALMTKHSVIKAYGRSQIYPPHILSEMRNQLYVPAI
jgi:hypothetical protein